MPERKLTTAQKRLLQSFLYTCCHPMFVWYSDGTVVAANDRGRRFIRQMGYETEKDLPSLSLFSTNWDAVPDNSEGSFWMDFRNSSGDIRTLQVLYSMIDEASGLGLITIPESGSGTESEVCSPDFFVRFEEAFQKLDAVPTSVPSTVRELNALIKTELHLVDFSFVPGQAFREFGVYPAFISCLNHEEILSRVSEEGEKGRFLPLPDGDNSGIWRTKWGFFYLDGLNHEYQNDADTFLTYLHERLDSYCAFLAKEKSNYLFHFENAINKVVNENILESVIITDTEYSIRYINAMAEIMFGFPNSDVVGHKVEDLLVTGEGLQSLIASDEQKSEIKYLHRRSGAIFPCSVTVTTMSFDGTSYKVFVMTDKTETEESRLKSEQLAQRAFLGDFASLLAHEIRNPVNNMRIWLANISNLAVGNQPIIDATQRIDDDCQRISQLVSNILTFSKPMALNKEELDLSMLISEIIEKWRLNFARKNIEVFFKPQPDLPKIQGDSRSLEQVLNNLIGNSVDALGTNGGVITLKVSELEPVAGKRQIMITESDNGPGIPPDKIDHIFEPFMTTKKTGNGWGLAISKRIVTSHKGTISVRSFEGGTVFEINLPISDGREQ